MAKYRVNYGLVLDQRQFVPGEEVDLNLTPEQEDQLVGNSLTLITTPKKSTKSPAQPAPEE